MFELFITKIYIFMIIYIVFINRGKNCAVKITARFLFIKSKKALIILIIKLIKKALLYNALY